MKLKLASQKPEVEGVITFIFAPNHPLTWEPGQYLHYILPHPNADDRGTSRWFTISSAPYEGHVSITTRFDGDQVSSFKNALRSMEPGQQIESDDGPKGNFTLQPNASRHIFIAGGIGITPYRSILLQLHHDNKPLNVDLFYANKDESFVFDDELLELEKQHSELRIRKFTGSKRIEEADFKEFVDDSKSIFYLSGPRPMVENYQHMLSDMGIAEERSKTDYFPGY